MNVRRSSILAALALLTTALVGCGGGAIAPQSTGGPAATIGAGETDVPAGATAGDGASGAIDVCQVVTAADVGPFFTASITAEEDTSQTGEFSKCFYQVSPHDGLPPMEIYVVNGDQAETAYGSFTGGNETHLPLAGVGDRAERSPGSASFGAVKGSTFCSVQLGAGNGSHYAGLPSPDANGNLPDAAAEAYALRLAALCAKVFAAS